MHDGTHLVGVSQTHAWVWDGIPLTSLNCDGRLPASCFGGFVFGVMQPGMATLVTGRARQELVDHGWRLLGCERASWRDGSQKPKVVRW